jgi:hypothetical protein
MDAVDRCADPRAGGRAGKEGESDVRRDYGNAKFVTSDCKLGMSPVFRA